MKLLLETLLNLGQNALNTALSRDAHTQHALNELQDCCIAMHILSLDKTIYLHIDMQKIFLSLRAPKSIDVSIRASAKNLWQMSNATPTPQQHVEIHGNIHVAQKLSQIFSGFQPDWEEALTHTLGDLVGHALAEVISHAHQYAKQMAQDILRQSRDYLVDEMPVVAAKPSIDAFITEVNQLRTQSDRIAARARLCQQRLEKICSQ